ncbi:MAG TPA: hypothetical protein VN743_00065 [Blastocatellia bacterium]|nr:hypothetical protein [Blastocatellia bacterium]
MLLIRVKDSRTEQCVGHYYCSDLGHKDFVRGILEAHNNEIVGAPYVADAFELRHVERFAGMVQGSECRVQDAQPGTRNPEPET